MYKNLTVSVVMPAFNEEKFIARAVRDLMELPEVDEVVVVDNCSTDATAALAREAGARVVPESKKGYGHASRTALLSATGDLIFIVEPDGTFRPADLYKFLPYSEEFDSVFGTRTSRSCIWTGANMGHFLRYGNWAVAKFLEYLHNGPCFTDVGCTFKMIRREALHKIAPLLTVGGSHFSPEFMMAIVRTRLRCVEIPVHYRTRLGESKITGTFPKAFRLGLRMIWMIFRYRFRTYPRFATTVADQVLIEIGDHRDIPKDRAALVGSQDPMQ
ncbi:MAG: glycosyltransferase family 2 protein [Thermoanaerobaculia bacterium]